MVYAAKAGTETLTQVQFDSIQSGSRIAIPVQLQTTITTKQDIVSYVVITLGSIITVVLMSLLKYWFPNIFGKVRQ